MRIVIGAVLAACAVGSAHAQATTSLTNPLWRAAYAAPATPPASTFQARDIDAVATLAGGGTFALAPVTGAPQDPIGALLAGESPTVWRSGETLLSSAPEGAVDSLEVTVGSVPAAPGLALHPADLSQYDAKAYDISLRRGWPGLVSLRTNSFALDVTPHAAFGMTSAGGSAEAGALVRFGGGKLDKPSSGGIKDRLAGGVKDGDDKFGERGRWYLFAAASGKAVGLNVLRNNNGFRGGGFSQDATGKLVGDTQAGVGWKRGPMTASIGYVHRDIKLAQPILGVGGRSDDVVAFSLSISPKR